MGLSDNHNAIVDILCTADKHLLQQIVVFYGQCVFVCLFVLQKLGFGSGIKFGDGKYEVKSADGKVRFCFGL